MSSSLIRFSTLKRHELSHLLQQENLALLHTASPAKGTKKNTKICTAPHLNTNNTTERNVEGRRVLLEGDEAICTTAMCATRKALGTAHPPSGTCVIPTALHKKKTNWHKQGKAQIVPQVQELEVTALLLGTESKGEGNPDLYKTYDGSR